jgi:hypothetical protein
MKLPTADAIARLVSDLLGKPTTARAVAPTPVPRDGIVSAIVDDEGALRAAVVVDRPLAAYAGAALALVPSGMADDALRSGAIPSALLDNYREVLNVVTNLLNTINPVHVRLGDSYTGPAAPAPKDVATILASPKAKLDLELQIAGYGKGRIRFAV